MNSISKAIDRLNHFVLYFISIVFALVTILTIYQVFARYILKSPLVWSEGLIRYAVIWIVLLGTAIALRKGLLISVETVLFLVPKKVKIILNYMILFINVIFLVILTVVGFNVISNLAHSTTGAIDIPVSWLYAAIPCGSILALINCIGVFFDLMTNKKEGESSGSTIIH